MVFKCDCYMSNTVCVLFDIERVELCWLCWLGSQLCLVPFPRRITQRLTRIPQKKFLVPQDLTVSQFQVILRKRLRLESAQAMFLFAESLRADNKKEHILLPVRCACVCVCVCVRE